MLWSGGLLEASVGEHLPGKRLVANEMLSCLAAAAAQSCPPQLLSHLRMIEWGIPNQLSCWPESCQYHVALLMAALFMLESSLSAHSKSSASNAKARFLKRAGPLSPRSQKVKAEAAADQTCVEEYSSQDDSGTLSDSSEGDYFSPKHSKLAPELGLSLDERAVAQEGTLNGPRQLPRRNVMTGVPLAVLTPRAKQRQRQSELNRVMGELHKLQRGTLVVSSHSAPREGTNGLTQEGTQSQARDQKPTPFPVILVSNHRSARHTQYVSSYTSHSICFLPSASSCRL